VLLLSVYSYLFENTVPFNISCKPSPLLSISSSFFEDGLFYVFVASSEITVIVIAL
jgi:hypothetical protein